VPERPLPAATRLAYGVGGIATAIKDAAVVHFLTIFYVQLAGLPGWLFGFASALAQVLDAFIDPALGTWSDNARTRIGRRHPFMLGAAIPYAAAFVLMFSPPAGLGHAALFAWSAAWMMVARVSLATFAIPHAALGAELSTDYDERTRIAGDRNTLAWLGGILLPVAAYAYLFPARGDVDGRLVAENYTSYAWLSAAAILATTLFSSLGTRHEIPRLPVPAERRRLRWLDPFRDVAEALRNRNFRRVFAALVLAGATTGVSTLLGAFASLYFWELSVRETQWLTLSAVVPTLVAFAAVGPLSRRFQKKPLFLGTMGVVIASTLAWYGGRLLGLLPPNGSPEIFWGAVISGFFTIAALVLNGSVWPSIVADVADEYELETGTRKDGVFFAAQAFAYKIPTGLGQGLGGLVIWAIGFEPGMRPGQIPADVLFRLGMVAGPLVAAALLLPMLAMWRYDISRARHAELRRALAERTASA
jgi:Na+/melibiose symporter-like transporter